MKDKIPLGLVGELCFGKEGLEKKDLRKNQFRIPVIVTNNVSENKTTVIVCKGKKYLVEWQ